LSKNLNKVIEIKKINQLFTKVKLQTDFQYWISEHYENLEHVEIREINSHSNNTKVISILKSETLTPYRYFIEYDVYQGLWYTVLIAIGKFSKPDNNGIMKIEKGIAKLCYNDDLSLYDGDIFFDSIYQ